MYSHTCACTSLCVKHVSLVVSLSASTHNTLTQPNLPLLPVSSVGLLLGPWAQSPRKLHQSKQRGGTELREYGDTKGLPCTVEDFRRDSNKAELPLNSEVGVNSPCCCCH